MQKISGGWGACPRGHALCASGPPPFYFPGSAPGQPLFNQHSPSTFHCKSWKLQYLIRQELDISRHCAGSLLFMRQVEHNVEQEAAFDLAAVEGCWWLLMAVDGGWSLCHGYFKWDKRLRVAKPHNILRKSDHIARIKQLRYGKKLRQLFNKLTQYISQWF